jgi:hypothetical protein
MYLCLQYHTYTGSPIWTESRKKGVKNVTSCPKASVDDRNGGGEAVSNYRPE